MTLGGTSPAWAEELTIFESSTQTSYEIPFYFYNCDTPGNQSEFVVPATLISSMSGKNITGLKFYSSNASFAWGSNIPAYKVYLKEIASTTLSAYSGDGDATTVYTGTLTVESGVFTITFTEPYEYNGGNLLVGTKVTTTGSYIAKANSNFYGDTSSDVTCSRSSDGNKYFIPKTTFTYENVSIDGPALTIKDGSTKMTSGFSYSFGLTEANATKKYTLTNPGSEDCTISVSPGTLTNGIVAELSGTTLSANKANEVTLTVTLKETTDNGLVTISSTSLAEDFTINVSGTVRDPNKLWCNFSSGLPTGWDNAGGWDILDTGADGITTGGGYARNTTYGTNKRFFTPLLTIAEGEKLYLKVKGNGSTASWNKLYIQYSANGTEWTNAKSLESITNVWQDVEVTEIPAGNWYIGFYGSYVYITDIYGGTESTAPVLSLSQSSYDFGLINENTTSTAITITNTGKSELTGMNLVSSNAAFTFNVTDDATTIAANGGTATFTVTMSSANAGTKNGTITIKSANADDLVLNVSGAVMKAGTTTETFNNNQKPERWTNSSDTYYYWNFSDGKASAGSGSQYSNYAYMITPKMTVSADDFLAIKIKAQNSNYGFLKVYTSTDGTFGSTPVKEISYSELSTSDYKTIIVNGLTSEVKYFKFEGYYVTLDEIAGLTYAPVLVVKDAEDAVQASPVAYAFGEKSANASVTYSFTNGGAGTLNITNVVVTNDPADGTYTTNWTESVATPFDLVITQNYDAEKAGAKTGSVVVTMSDASTFTINLSGTLLAANAPTLAVDNTLEFGKLTANDTQTVTVTNSGTGSMTVDIVSDNALFTVSPAQLTEIGAGASKTFDVTFHYDQVTAGNYGVKNANITVTPTYNAEAAIVINASAKAKDPEEWGEDFAGNALPDGWEVSATGSFTVANGIVSGHYSTSGTLTTPSLKIGSTADAMSFKYKRNNAAIDIKKQINGGAWTPLVRLPNSSYATDDEWQTYTITGLEAGNYKFQFTNDDYDLDDFEGFKLNTDAPAFGYYTNSECTAAAAATVTRNYGFVTEAPEAVVYYMKNDGTGTLNLTLGDVPTGFTAVLGKTSLAADESTTLTINMPTATKGYRGGDIVVTGKDSGDNTLGTFTVTASGVVEEEGKMNLNFATDDIPAGWTTNDWERNTTNGYVEIGYKSTPNTLQTTKLVASAGETLVVVAKQTYSSSSYTFGVKIKDADDVNADWEDLISAENIGTGYVMLHGTIANAGNYLVQFNGMYTQIQRIYGLAMPLEPVMVVYDGENVAGATKNFGMVSDEADAVWTLTVKNEGQAKLEGLTAELSGEQAAHYSAVITGATGDGNDEIEAGTQATITVKQLKDNLGAHEATLTISATGLDSKVIALSGSTRDHTLLYVDFENNELPEGWRKSSNDWTVSYGTVNNSSTSTASSLFTRPLTVTDANDVLSFGAQKYGSSNVKDLIVRYTTNGGVTWTDYDWSNYAGTWTEGETVKDKLTSSMQTFEITGIPAGTVVFEFCGKYLRIDDIQANYALADGAVLAFTENEIPVESGSVKAFGNLTADAEATYTLANNGNANYVGTVAKSNVNVAISGEGVTYEDNTLTIPAGKTAEITVTMPFAAPYGEKNGSMTITSESWVGDVAVNYTANLIDPDAINIDFASLPAGWYNNGWTVDGSAYIYSGVEKELITEQYGAESGKNVLSFKAKAQNGNGGTLKVYTSTDRKTWSAPTEIELTNEYVSQSLTELADGSYYVKFVSLNANIDDLTGLKKILPAPEHDLYVSASNIPAETKVPGTGITATATVHSLRANETGVYAKLFFDETVVASTQEDPKAISQNGSANFTLTGNVPATEKTYAAKIVVYYNDNSVAFETLTTDVTVRHTRQLAITDFVRDGEGDLSADVNNKVTAQFNVTVQNNSTCDLTADEVKVSIVNAAGEAYQMNDADNVTAATAVLAKDESVVIPVTLTISANEGGDFQFRAKELVSNTLTSEETPITIHVNAQAPQFGLKVKGGDALADGAAIDYGFIHSDEATTKQFTITNTGTKELVLTSIVAAEGFEATAVTEENKTIAVGDELDIDVTLKANQGKKQGTVVITYDVNNTPTTFTLNVSGRSVSADTWVEDFTEGIPATWENTNNNWTVEEGMAYSGGINTERTLMTPRLAATAGEELTYDLTFRYTGYTVTVEYSNDNRTSWTQYAVVDDAHAGEQTFTAPADGNYYLRFTATRYAQLDNFVGFQLNIPQHDMEIVASTVPATGKQYNTYTATVTLKENAGKDEDITAELWVNNVNVNATANVTKADKNAQTVVTLTWEPETTMDAVESYVKVTYAGGTLQTTPVNLTVAEVTTFDEDVNAAVAAITTPETVWLKHSLVSGWNTICLPFDVDYADIEGLFGNGAKVYDLKSYANNKLNFDCLTEGKMSGGTPYLIHVESVTDIDQRVDNVTISSLNTTAGTSQSVFKGTYVPMTAGALEGKYGVTSDNKIAKGNSKTTMKGFRGYFEGISSMARISTFDETTGITRVYDYGEVFGKDDRVYNLNGQHVENAKKGVFIINGKKVVIK